MVRVPGQGEVRGPGPGPALPAATSPAELLTGPDIQAATADLQALLAEQETQRRREIAAAEAQEIRTAIVKGETELRLRADALFEEVARDPDHGTLAQRFDDGISAEIEARVKALPAEAREMARASYELVRRTGLVAALGAQRERSLAAAEQNLEDSLANFRDQVQRDPGSLDSTRAAAVAIIRAEGEAIGLTPEAIDQRIADSDRVLVIGALRGLPAGEAAALLTQGRFDDALSAEERRSLTEAFEVTARREAEREASRLNADIEDHLASLLETGQGNPQLADSLADVLSEEDFADFRKAEERTLRIRDAVKSFPLQRPEEIRARVDSFRPEAAASDEERALHLAIAQEADAVLAARAADPALAAMALPGVASGLEAARKAEDPAAFKRALEDRRAAQGQLGVSKGFQRVTTNAVAQEIVARVLAAEPDKRAAEMLRLQRSYGKFFPQLMLELDAAGLDRRFQVLAVVADHPGLSRELNNVIETGSQALREGLIRTLVLSAENQVIRELDDFARAFTLGDQTQAAITQMNEFTALIQDLAVLNLRRGLSPSEAAKKAADDVINDRYTVQDGLWIPNSIDGERISPEKIALLIEQRQTREAILAFDPEPVTDLGETPDSAVARNRTIETAVNSGVWVTNETGTKAFLMLPDTAGVLHPFVDAEGRRFEVDYLEASLMPMFLLDSPLFDDTTLSP